MRISDWSSDVCSSDLTIKLYPVPVAQCTALLALESVKDAVSVLSAARKGFGAALTGFELIDGNSLKGVVQCYSQQRIPFEGQSADKPWSALLELSDSDSTEPARERCESTVGVGLEAGMVQDAVIAA